MSTATSAQTSPLFRLPCEIRDQIYTHVVHIAPKAWLAPHLDDENGECLFFPESWTPGPNQNMTVLYHPLPALCYVSRQVFLEFTPIFLPKTDIFSPTASTSHLLFDWLGQFPYDQAFKAVKDMSFYYWTPSTPDTLNVQPDLLAQLHNLEYLHLTFPFPDASHGILDDDYDWQDEENLLGDTGIPYPPKLYFSLTPDDLPNASLYPPSAEVVDREKAALAKALDEFVVERRLEVVLQLPKLQALDIEFTVDELGEMRHNFSRSLFIWFTGKFEELGREVVVTTGYGEDP